jgi:hypothetical protein
MGINDWFLIQLAGGFDQPLHENLQASSVEIEPEFALLKREGDVVGVSFQFGYSQAINHGEQVEGNPNEFAFGPIVEVAIADTQSAIHQADRYIRGPGRSRF